MDQQIVTPEMMKKMMAKQMSLGIGPESIEQPAKLVQREKEMAAAKEGKPMALPKSSPRRLKAAKGPLQAMPMQAMPMQADQASALGTQAIAAAPAPRVMPSDRQMAIPNYGGAMDPKRPTMKGAAVKNYGETPRPREYKSFGEFLKTMGLGK